MRDCPSILIFLILLVYGIYDNNRFPDVLLLYIPVNVNVM